MSKDNTDDPALPEDQCPGSEFQSLTEDIQTLRSVTESSFRRLELRFQKLTNELSDQRHHSGADSGTNKDSLLQTIFDFDEATDRFANAAEKIIRVLRQNRLNDFHSKSPKQGRTLWSLLWPFQKSGREPDESLDGQKDEQLFCGFFEGLELFRQRIHSLLKNCTPAIEKICATGVPVNPEEMNVIQVVHQSDFPDGNVLEVIRPGYKVEGRVLRFAEVVANKKVEENNE